MKEAKNKNKETSIFNQSFFVIEDSPRVFYPKSIDSTQDKNVGRNVKLVNENYYVELQIVDEENKKGYSGRLLCLCESASDNPGLFKTPDGQLILHPAFGLIWMSMISKEPYMKFGTLKSWVLQADEK